MKKIIILLMLLGTYLFVSVDLFASQYEYQGITLDTQIADLNNYTLVEVFDTYNRIKNVNWFTSDPAITWTQQNETLLISLSIENNNVISGNLNRTLITSGRQYYTRFSVVSYYDDSTFDVHIGGTQSYQITALEELHGSFKQQATTPFVIFGFSNTQTDNYFRLYNTYVIDMTSLGFPNLSQAEMDYYSTLYIGLKNGINLEYFYNSGENDGYDSGYDSGYDAGLIVGYDNGEAQGLIDGYNVGYNEGMDYAATNNITLLSVFQLIIGVVMSMLGFIINIELFGISIASVLGTLAIGIAIIWTLKLIRG